MVRSAAAILLPPPNRNAGEWADAHRVLPPESPEPGPWRTDRVPFWWEIYAAFADEEHDTVIVVCASQSAKTEAILNLLGHRFTDGPFVPALYIGPTEKQVRSISKDRLDKMIRSTPVLIDRLDQATNSLYEKFIAGTRLGLAWAGSATELSSHPAGLALIDERDRMQADTCNEGDPVSLARARLKNYHNRKLGVFSTPTVEGASPIWNLLEEGTLQFWAWPCLGCGAYFVPHLALLKWPPDSTPADAFNAATVECPECGHAHKSRDKQELNAAGIYIRHRKLADNETNTKAVFGMYVADEDPRPNRTASFWISGLASPWVSFGQLAKVLLEAYRSGEQERIQAEINTWGGELYRVRGEAPAWVEVGSCRREYSPRQIVHGVQKLVLGADVQKSGIYYVIRGWGFNSESWLIDEGFIAGETEHETVWAELRKIITQPIGSLRIDRAFIDSGYRPGDAHRRPDHAVYTFCRSLLGIAYPTKGHDTLDQPFTFRNIDYSIGGRQIRHGIKLFHINTDHFKRWIHARIRWPDGEPGGWHLHNAATEDYCKQLVSEELVLKASGRATWVRKSRNNHFLDAEVNASAAAYSLAVHKLERPPDPEAPPPEEVAPQRTAAATRYRRNSLW
ncbi:MAG: phage terminase large subunit family protein [Gammaproteobacteria bacterium]|nr:phage terminase large subunit family protein [Gammaproteobacteria bacterium]